MMDSLFNRDFYPTPIDVIERMLQYSDVRGKFILEPSAGSGNIVDYVRTNGAKDVIACEKNRQLHGILQGKCTIINDDFLNVKSEDISHIDMIVMNPPFSADEKHISHAFEIAPGGCEIIALCNSDTLSRYGTVERRKLQETIEKYGSSETLGQLFKDAERTTNVCVSVVRLYKPGTHENEFEGFFMDEEEEQQFNAPGLVQYNFVRDAVGRYCEAIRRYDAVMEQSNAINELTKGIGGTSIQFGAYGTTNEVRTGITKERYKKQLQKDAWKWLLGKFNMQKYVTSSLRDDINKFVEQQSNIPFTMKNIYRMVEIIIATNGNRMEQTLADAFDLICSYSADNSTAGEKWRTNSDYMINRKFIVPYIASSFYSYNGYVSLAIGRNVDRLEDVVKALCYISGRNYDELQSLYKFVSNSKLEWGKWYEWGFFKIKAFKKGTMHFQFLDENLWFKFNTEVSRIKGWVLPKKTKGAKHNDIVVA